MKKRFARLSVLALILALSLIFVGTASAQTPTPTPGPLEPTEEPLEPCEGESVTGTIVGYDETTGEVIIDTGEGLCVVSLEGEYEHPIVALFDEYFGEVDTDTEGMSEALEATQVWVVYDEGSDTWSFASEGDEGAVPGTVVDVVDNGDDTYTVEVAVEGQEGNVFITSGDGEQAMAFQEALDALNVDWGLMFGEEGASVMDVGGEVAAYHEDGTGFGVLAKFYAMAAESEEACASEPEGSEPTGEPTGEPAEPEACTVVTVDQLITEFKAGTGIGKLFKEYGKPAILGVGHIRQALEGKGNSSKPNKANKSDNSHKPPWAGVPGKPDKPDNPNKPNKDD